MVKHSSKYQILRIPSNYKTSLIQLISVLYLVLYYHTIQLGLHNPLKNPDRYVHYGEVCFQIAAEMKKKKVHDYFTRLIQRVVPKHTL